MKILKQNLHQLLKMCKRSYTKGTANNQKVQKLVPVLDGNLTVKKLKNFL